MVTRSGKSVGVVPPGDMESSIGSSAQPVAPDIPLMASCLEGSEAPTMESDSTSTETQGTSSTSDEPPDPEAAARYRCFNF